MEFKELAKARYSCRKFTDKQISDEQLQEILEIGRLAPTAKNLQEQRIFVIQKPEGLAKIDEITPCRYGAPTVLVVGYDKDEAYVYPDDITCGGMEDATIVATHLTLAAANAGVDSCWLNRFNPQTVNGILGLPDNISVVMLLDLGYAAEGVVPAPKHTDRKPLEETVKYL